VRTPGWFATSRCSVIAFSPKQGESFSTGFR
jgi:hypothetical protein